MRKGLAYRLVKGLWPCPVKKDKGLNIMDRIYIKAYAKINLTLDVVGKRPDGYHDVEMIMQSVDLWDEIVLKKTREGIELDSNIRSLPKDERNIAWRAAQLIKEEFRIPRGVHITINKNIPIEAGMAGGSADCAGVLSGLNQLWGLGMSGQQLRGLGKGLGADVPFCLTGGTALAQGIGDILTPIDFRGDIWLVLIKPKFGVSTKKVYTSLKLEDIKKRPNNKRMIRHLESGRVQDVAEGLVNVLEEVTIPMHPEISWLKAELMDQGALGSLMSGSGPTVYAIFRDKGSANAAAKALKGKYEWIYALKTIQRGLNMGTRVQGS